MSERLLLCADRVSSFCPGKQARQEAAKRRADRRSVKGRSVPTMTVPAAPAAVATAELAPPAATPAAFSHRAPNGLWESYATEQATTIAGAMAARPAGGEIRVAPSLPFVVRWGSQATSSRMATPPTGMVQVNLNSGNVRLVRRDDDTATLADSLV